MNKVWKINLIVFVLIFLVQISLVSAYTYGDYIGSWDTAGDTCTSIQGLTVYSGFVYVGCNAQNEIMKFQLDGTYVSKWAITGDNGNMIGLWTNGEYLYVLDNPDHKVYVYTMEGTQISSWTTDGGDGVGPHGLTGNKTHMWVTGQNPYIWLYSMSGYTGTYVTEYPTIQRMHDLEYFNGYLYLMDGYTSPGVDKFYKHELDLTATNENFTATATQENGYGCGIYNGKLYASDSTDNEVYIYYIDSFPNLISPSENSIFSSEEITFIVDHSIGEGYNLQNTTYYIWDSDGNIFNQSTYSINSSNTTKQDFNLFLGDYIWNAYTCGESVTETLCKWAISNYSFSVGPSLDSVIYTPSTYETNEETFKANYHIMEGSTISSAQIIYNGTNYTVTTTSTATTLNISKTFDIPLTTKATDTKNLQFRLVTTKDGYESISLTSRTQNVSEIHLALCNATYTVPYINFTFKDEATSAIINTSTDLATFDYWIGSGIVTKEYIFQNTTDNFNYAFCFAPADKPITIDVDFKYSKTGYPQRTHTYDDKVLTNSTTTKILYLLSSTDGIYSTIQFLDAATNDPIPGVEVTAEREILGTWTLINPGITDSAGAITFWVNPDYEHKITAIKTGYANVQETIIPTQTSYTIFMGTSATVSVPGYRYKNINYITYPAAGRLEPNTVYTFGFNVTAGEGNVVSCRIDIKNLTLSTVATSSTGCGAYGGNISVSYNTGSNSKLFGYYYVDIGDGLELFKANDAWYVESFNATSTGGLISFFESLGDLPEWGDTHNRQEFSKVVFFFFIMILTIGVFTFFSGYELSSPGAALILVWAFVAFGAVSGIIEIEGLTPYDWWNQYVYFIIVSFLFFGFILNKIRRDNM